LLICQFACKIQNKCSIQAGTPAQPVSAGEAGVMPVNYSQVQAQARDMGAKTRVRQQELRARRDSVLALLGSNAGDLQALQDRVKLARNHNATLRCAVPVSEWLNACFPVPILPANLNLLAADGSQINPDRHAAVDFSLINVGGFHLPAGSTQLAHEVVKSNLLYDDQVYTQNGLITEEMVALMRDLEERQLLADLAAGIPPPVVTLTDGQLELFREPKETKEFTHAFEQYLEVLARLEQLGVATAGYVERPRSDLVVRLLELVKLPQAQLAQAGKERPFLGVTDASLFANFLTTPGDRSAVFAIQSASSHRFVGGLKLHFFYVNVGKPEKPHLARVELPQWVVVNPPLLDALHAALVEQCRVLGSRPYPYVLYRAHELAVVTMEDKNRVEEMIQAELVRQGIITDKSTKQGLKDLPGRTGYGRYKR
jgi:uncharacterized membrane protein